MHMIFLEAKQKIKQLKEESKHVLRNRSPMNLIQSTRQSRNNGLTGSISRGQYQSSSVRERDDNDRHYQTISLSNNHQMYQTVTSTNKYERPSSPFQIGGEQQRSGGAPPLPVTSVNKYFDRNEYDRQISQRRKEKISTLKTQLNIMLGPQVATQPTPTPSYLTASAGGFYNRSNEQFQMTPDKRNYLTTEQKRFQTLESNQQSSGSKYQNTGESKHSALKSRPAAINVAPLKAENQTVFKLVTTGSTNSFGFQPSPSPQPKGSYSSQNSESKTLTQNIKLNEVAFSGLEGQLNINPSGNNYRNLQTESKFSIYTYSDTDEPSVIQQHINHLELAAQAQLVNKIESQMEGEPSITFISSKFIKSNSVESLPELQVQSSNSRPESQNVKKESLDLNNCVKVLNHQLNAHGSPESAGKSEQQLFTCITNTQGVKKRTQSSTAAHIAPEILNILDYSASQKSSQNQQSRAAYIQIQNQEEKPKPSRQPTQVSPIRTISPSGIPKITDIFKKEDLQRAQIALLQTSDDQIRKMPVLYVNELRRLARTIQRIFGDHVIQGNVI